MILPWSKMVNAPIFHVNGDDPEAVVFIAQIALDYRMKFKKDVVIDMICYRRHGHNGADEPSATQPMMYKKIKALPTVREIYVQKMQDAAIFTHEEAEQLKTEYRNNLEAGRCVAPNINSVIDKSLAFHWAKYTGNTLKQPVDTGVHLDTIKFLMDQLEHLPEEFERHARIEKIIADRHKMTAGTLPLDWGYAETLAYASLIDDGYNIRLSGQDSGRGTFFHRHVVWHNQLKNESWVPLRNLQSNDTKDSKQTTGNFLVIDSLLSEEAVLAFEYGYASTDPETLVIWEAQFGDFANNAQVVIDQFISAGEQKWQRLCGLVMLLPHGFEGQGAEHSSARLERFLQLCAQNNMQVCVPTTPAQVFHMFRRQMLQNTRKPLICMSPKSLLRHKSAVSTLEALSSGTFENVIDDIDIQSQLQSQSSSLHSVTSSMRRHITRIILCSGKVYYDLLESKRQNQLNNIALIRIEQLYPFPEQQLQKIINKYTNTNKLIWCQEEPRNQGAWYSIRHNLELVLRNSYLQQQNLRYAGRDASAAPAVGVARIHIAQQKKLVDQALGLASESV
ncbi:MAG: 2-oxoglutarate dehydrogenase E1 component [gamma proteobacterium symbiont of Bathyaustriella thionipta]|nr:2-oxoglutarate dehydrogenase E1 component [gamma proteobacterium symbiont of Bathyaustriella thionipta]MCU7950680.1 2-oxoglutarate dehydrogenase E1 component [gamma proteobacterium symbiont of Bathyaustriella thionipta]MCU7952899.1 2-oxoglutarate dehydrogenase E1 component [gamma proteobacterium symbiont of Bathyaustriella thionipta]MCU7957174.1 2-oxoglutarate dehydrogenase E1 component [gamma proteobacterium symbiont of Bathyaustriella thionipta]MCU7966665.1 2-oxoglutarate dehydrogenase E1 